MKFINLVLEFPFRPLWFLKRQTDVTYGHRLRKTWYPVRSALIKPQIDRLVIGWVTTSESRLLYVFHFFASKLFFLIFVQPTLLRFALLTGARFFEGNEMKVSICSLVFPEALHIITREVRRFPGNLFFIFEPQKTKIKDHNKIKPYPVEVVIFWYFPKISDIIDRIEGMTVPGIYVEISRTFCNNSVFQSRFT